MSAPLRDSMLAGPGNSSLNRCDQICARSILQQIAGRAGADRVKQPLVGVVCCPPLREP